MEDIRENVIFEFTPEFKVIESKEGKWVQMGGVALTEGTSRNNNVYSKENLNENDQKEFKWLFGHPDFPESHVVGAGKVFMEEGVLRHEGKIRNTSTHPDVIESVKDGFLGPSIHASAKKVIRKEGKYHVEGLSIDGIGLVAFQGVKNATIDYAIAESFEKKESDSNGADEINKDKEADNMSEEKQPEVPVEAPVEDAPQEEPKVEKEEEKAEEPAKEEEKAEEPVENEAVEALKKEVSELKEAKKRDLVESICAINKELKVEDLMKESDERLDLMKTYEQKLAKTSGSQAIVENEEEADSEKLVEKDGLVSMSETMYANFNKEIRERVR